MLWMTNKSNQKSILTQHRLVLIRSSRKPSTTLELGESMSKQTRYIQFILHQQENHRNDQHARLNSRTLATDRSLKIKICTQTSKSVTNDPETHIHTHTHLHIDIKVLDRKGLCALVQFVPHYLHVGKRMY